MNIGFSNRMKEVFNYVREEVIRLGDQSIGVEHLFLGILREGGGSAINTLKSLGVDPKELRIIIESNITKRNSLTNIEKASIEVLESAGLIVPRKGGNGFYDRFRNRIIVPIHDRQNRVIGFGGRSLDGSEPKYLNSPETEIFEKGKNLFGFDKSTLSIRKKDYAVVVEGYFDVMALHDSGITNVVASLGTALSRNQITLLSRATDSKKILLNFDSDNAGIRAANRAISEVENLAIQGQLDLRILQLPSGKDPDEFLKDNSSSEYEALAAKSPLWMDWQIDQSLKDLDLRRSDQFQVAVSNLLSLL